MATFKASMMATKKPRAREEELFASCSFSDLGLHPNLCLHLQDKMGFEAPTKIQAEAIPFAIAGHHMLVKSPTGSGKTLAYLAPIINLLQIREPRIERSDGTFALVLVPTRELCIQVFEIAKKLVHRFHWIVPGYVIGGENRNKEKARLRKGISVLIATPGRLLDHLKNTSSFLYVNLQWIVFDEADRILELGFGKELEEILERIGSRNDSSDTKENRNGCSRIPRQNLLLSATLNAKVNRLADISLDNPVLIGVDEKKTPYECHVSFGIKTSLAFQEDEPSILESYKLPAQLVQRYVKVPCGSRLAILLSIVKSYFEKEASQKIVIFLSTCDSVDFHFALLNQFEVCPASQIHVDCKEKFINFKVYRLHGNMLHDERRTAFQGFSSDKSAVLLSTDVSARGLDFPKVRCIIQYDSPGEASEYVHRVGRTARLGEHGEAILFLQPVEAEYLRDLELHGVSLTEYPLRKFLDSFCMNRLKHHRKKLLDLDLHPWVVFLQRALETFIAKEMKQLAIDAFCSWLRAYAAHRGELKKIFMVRKLHLGHVARSFGLKEQPSLVGKSHQILAKRRKKQLHKGLAKRRKVSMN